MKTDFRSWLLLCVCGFAAGCAHKNYNVANPVVGPAPPRIAAGTAALAQSEEDNQLKLVSFEPNQPLPDSAIVARVNGTPILAGDLLEKYRIPLEQARAQATPDKYRLAQDMLIQRELNTTIDTMLAVDAVRSKLKTEQLESVNQQLEEHFINNKIPDLKAEFKVSTTAELDAALHERGASLEMVRKVIFDNELAGQYIQAQLGKEPNPNRTELFQRYQAQQEQYAIPLKVKWQQLQVSIQVRRSTAKAREVMDQALAELNAGADFRDVVKKYSDGPNKDSGGSYDWTQPSSLANADLRKALLTLHAGETSPVMTVGNTLQIVLVTDRQEASYKPFDELQSELRQEIVQEWRETRLKQILEELRDKAVIETIYDEPDPAGSAILR